MNKIIIVKHIGVIYIEVFIIWNVDKMFCTTGTAEPIINNSACIENNPELEIDCLKNIIILTAYSNNIYTSKIINIGPYTI